MANRVLADLAVKISANTAEFSKSLKNSERSLNSLQKTAQTAQRALGALGLAFGIGTLAKSIFDLGIRQEQTNVAFGTFLGSAEKARTVLAELNKFSISTPFTPTQVIEASKALLAFGIEGNKLTPTLKLLGDISAGTGKDLKELAVIFGQIRSTGRLMGQDLLQLINAGFNPLQEISRTTGKSVADLKKEMERGLISFDQVENAFRTATSEGGLFFNLMEKQSQTVGGRLSTLGGNVEDLGKTIFGLASGPIPSLVEALNDLTLAANNALKTISFEEIADVGLERFRTKLEEVTQGLKSTDEAVKNTAISSGNLFAGDVVDAINQVKNELQAVEKTIEEINSRPIKNQAALSQIQRDLKISNQQLLILKAELKGLEGIKVELFQNLTDTNQSTETAIVTLNSLNAAKKKLLETYNATDVANRTELASITRQIQEYDKQIDSIERLKSSILSLKEVQQIDPFDGISLEADIRPLGGDTGLLPFQEELAIYLETIREVSDDSASAVAESQQRTREEINKTVQAAFLLGDALGNAFGSALAGEATFAQGLARITDTVVQQYGRQALAAAIAKAVKSSPTSFGVVLAASAAVAGVSAILRKAAGYRSTGGGGGGGFGSSARPSSFAFAQDSAPVRLVSDIQIKGQDLYVVLSNYEKNNRTTRNG